jgi:hypothetical protein
MIHRRTLADPQAAQSAAQDARSAEWNPHDAWRCRIRLPRRLYAACDLEDCDGIELVGEEPQSPDAERLVLARALG